MPNKEHMEIIKLIEELANQNTATQELKDKIKSEFDISVGIKEREE